ncbi:family 10 glycosylhydrolase [bacterium]|nr:family 10 glycosylhydrolase [bacterium]
MKNKFLTIITAAFLLIPTAAFPEEIQAVFDDPLGIDKKTDDVLFNVPVSFKPYKAGRNEVVFNESKKYINVIDPNVSNNKGGSYFPGGRGVNQLVIYTPSYGERTRTNEFGTEAIVEGNIVSEISGADSLIPQNGIVISGHGAAKNWMTSSLKVGTKVFIDEENSMLYAYTTSESYIYETEKKIEETDAIINYYKSLNNDYNWKVPASYLDDAREYLKKAQKNPEQVQKYSKLAIDTANDAIKSVLPYKAGELKGVWLRPTETTREEIISTLDDLKQTGIDNVLLETYYHGKTIYPSKVMQNYGLIAQNEIFNGIDPLKIWIEEGRKRNIKVQVWFETFYVGNKNPKDNPTSILAQFPDWGNKIKRDADSQDAATKSVTEHNGYFIDPANPYVQDFLYKLLKEIIANYHPDGINLDYIRYPQIMSKSDAGSWGYTKYAREEFKAMYGEDPINLTRSNPLWSGWENYRRSRITNFVKRAGELGRQNNVYVSAVIFPDRLQALEQKQQDWKTWSTNNYIDGFTPMFLTCDSKTARVMMQEVIRAKSPQTDLYAGLYVTFMNGSEEDLIRQIHEARKLDAKGVIIFDYAHLGNKYASTLSTSVFAPGKAIASTKAKIQQPQVQSSKIKKDKKKRFWF